MKAVSKKQLLPGFGINREDEAEIKPVLLQASTYTDLEQALGELLGIRHP